MLDASRVVDVVSAAARPGPPPRARRGEPRAAGAAARPARREAAAAAAPARRGAREPRAGSRSTICRAPPFTGTRERRAGARRARAVRRLAVLLPRLGPEGEVPGDPRATRPRASSTTTPRRCCGEIVQRRVAARARRLRLLAGARRGRRRRGRRTRASASSASRPTTATAAPIAASPTSSRPADDTLGAFAVSIHGADELAARYEARARRLPRDHRQGARRPARGGVRRVAPPARAPRVVRARRAAERGRPRRGAASAASARRSATRPAPITARRRSSSRCSEREAIGIEPDGELRDDARRGGQRDLPRTPAGTVLRGRPDRPRPARGLRSSGSASRSRWSSAASVRVSSDLGRVDPGARLSWPVRAPSGAAHVSMRTTLKRGVGRGAAHHGNGKAVYPPGTLSSRHPLPPAARRRGRPPSASSGASSSSRSWSCRRSCSRSPAAPTSTSTSRSRTVRAHTPSVVRAAKTLDIPLANHAAIALVIGYDHRAGVESNRPSLSDTLMLVRADPSTKTISLLSFPRDLDVPIYCGRSSDTVGHVARASTASTRPTRAAARRARS